MYIILGCGYIGFNLSIKFENNKESYMVVGLPSLYSAKIPQNKFLSMDAIEFCYKHSDLIKNSIVINVLGFSNATLSIRDISTDIDNAYKYNIKLIETLLPLKIRKFIFMSSGGTVYGDLEVKHKEESCLMPINAYGLQKVFIEHYIRIINLEFKSLPYVIIRASNPYGGLHYGVQGIIDVAIQKCKSSEELVLWAPGTNLRDYIYIDDFLDAIHLILTNDAIVNETINVGSGIGTSVNRILQLVETEIGKPLKITQQQNEITNISTNILDVSKVTNLTGFSLKIPIEQGIKKVVQGH